jgi:hypothetical protein
MAEQEAVFPIRFPTDTSGIKAGVSELERLRSALQEDQKQIAGLQKAMTGLKLDPDVQAYQKMQNELKKLGIEEDKASKKLKELQDQRAKMVAGGADAKKLAEFDEKGGAAVGALWKTQERIAGLKKGIGELETKPAVKQFKDLGLALKDSEGRMAENQSKYLALGGDMTKVGEKVQSGWEKLASGADQAGLGVGNIKGKFEALKALGPAGIIAAAVVTVVALGVALAKTGYELAKFALASADAARSTELLMEAAAGSQSGGKQLGAMVRRLRTDFAGSREEIAGMVIDLRRSGLQGTYLEKTVRMVGIATKTMGDAAGGVLKGLVEKGAMTNRFVLNPFDLKGTGIQYNDVARQLAKMTGRTVATVRAALQNGQVKLADGILALEAATKMRLGSLAKRQLLALPEQTNRAAENLKDIFAQIDPSKALIGLSGVLELLDETTETGRTLRTLAKTIFQPFFDFVGSSVFPLIRSFFLGMALGIIEVSIATLQAYIYFKKTFGDAGLFKGVDSAKLAFQLGAAAIFSMVGAALLLAAALGAVVATFAVLTAPVWMLAYGIYRVIKAISDLRAALKAKFETPKLEAGALTNAVQSATESAQMSADLKAAGVDAADGAAAGIKAGTPTVEGAMANMAQAGLDAFTSKLKIESPSKVLAATTEIGIGGGVTKGIDESRAQVSQAMQRLVNPSDAIPNGATGNGASGGAKPRPMIQISIDTLNVGGDGQGGISKPTILTQLVELFEEANRQAALVPN